MPVNCKIAAGRDESDCYEALGIVGEGPLGAFGSGHKLDAQFHHGYPGSLGLRQVLGRDPAGAQDWFSLDESGDQTGGDWRKVFSGNSTYKDNFAAGTPFLVIRRSDSKGLQLTRLGEHTIQAIVNQGMSGWVWTAPGVRSQRVLTNPVWIMVNMLLRVRGLRFADAATAEHYFDVNAAIAAAVGDEWPRIPTTNGSSQSVVLLGFNVGSLIEHRQKPVTVSARRFLLEAIPGRQLFGERRCEYFVDRDVLRLGDLYCLLVQFFRHADAHAHCVAPNNFKNSAGLLQRRRTVPPPRSHSCCR